MASKANANRRRRLRNNPAVAPEMRWFLGHLESTGVFGTTTTTTTTTTSTTSTTTTTTTSTTTT